MYSPEPPRGFRVTWAAFPLDAPPSEVEVRLAPSGPDRTDLEHVAVVPDEFWDQFGLGAVGAGWDGGLLGLALHLGARSVRDPIAWQLSEEGRAFFTASSDAWGDAFRASGAAPDAVARAVANTTSFYAPDPRS